jgi:hypothetical protein
MTIKCSNLWRVISVAMRSDATGECDKFNGTGQCKRLGATARLRLSFPKPRASPVKCCRNHWPRYASGNGHACPDPCRSRTRTDHPGGLATHHPRTVNASPLWGRLARSVGTGLSKARPGPFRPDRPPGVSFCRTVQTSRSPSRLPHLNRFSCDPAKILRNVLGSIQENLIRGSSDNGISAFFFHFASNSKYPPPRECWIPVSSPPPALPFVTVSITVDSLGKPRLRAG